MNLDDSFPGLRGTTYAVTSPATPSYNCIAWAAGDTDAFWWPDAFHVGFWPPGVPRREAIEAFSLAYEQVGYRPCETSLYEPGFEKIAIFADVGGRPKHAARQLADGAWTSKLGKGVDIRHATLDSLAGELYGRPIAFLKRPLAGV